jgi:hypothetical protein
MIRRCAVVLSLVATVALTASAADEALLIPKGAKVYVAPMEGFETYLSAAIMKKEVPVSIVANKDLADFEITGTSETQKAGWAKTIMTGNSRSDERGSITVTNLKTGVVVYAYAADKGSAVRGKQSVAESCAKHLKERIDKGR